MLPNVGIIKISAGEQPTRMVGGGVRFGEKRVGRQRRVVGVVRVRRRVDELVAGLAGGQQPRRGAGSSAVQQPRLSPGAGRHARRQDQWRPQRGRRA